MPDAEDANPAGSVGEATVQRRVVIAEDDADLRTALAHVFDRAGFRATCVADGASLVREVVASLSEPELCVHLVVTDIEMPAQNGLSAIEELRRRRVLVPIVVISGSGDRAILGRALELGADHALDKPVDFARLISLAHEIAR